MEKSVSVSFKLFFNVRIHCVLGATLSMTERHSRVTLSVYDMLKHGRLKSNDLIG